MFVPFASALDIPKRETDRPTKTGFLKSLLKAVLEEVFKASFASKICSSTGGSAGISESAGVESLVPSSANQPWLIICKRNGLTLECDTSQNGKGSLHIESKPS